MFRAEISLDDDADKFDEHLDDLPTGFRRTLLPARESLAKILGLSVADPGPAITERRAFARTTREVTVKAELIATETQIFITTIGRINRRVRMNTDAPDEAPRFVSKRLNTLYVHSLGPCFKSEVLGQLVTFLNDAFSVELKPYKYSSEQLDDLKEEGRLSPDIPSEEDIMAAQVLSERAIRTLAVAIKQSSGLLVGDLEKQLPVSERQRTEEIRAALQDAGLTISETVVICKKTGSQVARVSDSTSLEAFAKEGLRCSCGNAMDEEWIDAAVSTSDGGRRLLDGSYWLTLLLVHYLASLGVPIERILVEQVTGGDEIDCIADIDGKIVLFELKDKEFNLGSAYSFGAKIGIIDPDYAVIVTTAHVGADAKEHFARSRQLGRRGRYGEVDVDGQAIVYIEGVSSLRDGLMELISQVSMSHVEDALTEVLSMSSVPATSVLGSLNERFVKIDPLSAAVVHPRETSDDRATNPTLE